MAGSGWPQTRAQSGVDGVLLTDLSVEEAAGPVAQLREHGLDTIFLAAPTSTERRLKLVAEYSSGFVYVVSRTGVTGERATLAAGVEELCRKLRGLTEKPLAVGFGVSTREHVEATRRLRRWGGGGQRDHADCRCGAGGGGH